MLRCPGVVSSILQVRQLHAHTRTASALCREALFESHAGTVHAAHAGCMSLYMHLMACLHMSLRLKDVKGSRAFTLRGSGKGPTGLCWNLQACQVILARGSQGGKRARACRQWWTCAACLDWRMQRWALCCARWQHALMLPGWVPCLASHAKQQALGSSSMSPALSLQLNCSNGLCSCHKMPSQVLLSLLICFHASSNLEHIICAVRRKDFSSARREICAPCAHSL